MTALSVAASLHALIAPLAERLGRPRVRALHLPPPLADGSRRGEFAAIELDDGSLGLSYVLLDGTLAALRGGPWAGELRGRDALDVAAALLQPPGVPRTLGWAAAQALAHALLRRVGWQPAAAGDSLAALSPQPGDHIGLVGLFGPLMQRLVASGARITVVELRPELAGQQDGYEVTLRAESLRDCNKVLATGTLLLNDTLDTVLAHCRRAERVAVIGPSVGVLPELLFERGVHVVGGTWIRDAVAYVEALGDGRERGDAAFKFTLPREDWPGWRALLARL